MKNIYTVQTLACMQLSHINLTATHRFSSLQSAAANSVLTLHKWQQVKVKVRVSGIVLLT